MVLRKYLIIFLYSVCVYFFKWVSHFISDIFCILCFMHERERERESTKIDVLLLCVVDHYILEDRCS